MGWRRRPHGGQRDTRKNGSYNRHPWGLEGREVVRVQRYWCTRCRRSYAEEKAWLVKGSCYTRVVLRMAIGLWQHLLTPAQERRERKRHYKHPGQSPLEVATGASIPVSYSDALAV